MGDLDELAKATHEVERVRATRMYPPHQVYISGQNPQRPRSAFMAGFAGTFGVIAAILVIAFVIDLMTASNAARKPKPAVPADPPAPDAQGWEMVDRTDAAGNSSRQIEDASAELVLRGNTVYLQVKNTSPWRLKDAVVEVAMGGVGGQRWTFPIASVPRRDIAVLRIGEPEIIRAVRDGKLVFATVVSGSHVTP